MSSGKSAAAAILAVLVFLLLVSVFLRVAFREPATTPEAQAPSSALWETRDFETILQGLLILGGVFAILMLLRSAKEEVKR